MHDVLVGNLAFSKPDLLEIKSTGTIKEVLECFRQNRILSVPVYDEKRKKYMGILSVLDLLLYITFDQIKGEVLPDKLEPVSWTLKDTPVSRLIGLSNECYQAHELKVVDSTTSCSECLPFLGAGNPRLLVFLGYDKDDNMKPMLRLLSSTDFVKYINAHMHDFSNIAKKSLLQLVERQRLQNFLTLPYKDAITLTVFREMQHRGVDAVALLDEEGKVKATLSASDLRHLYQEEDFAFNDILLTVDEYLKKIHGNIESPNYFIKFSDTFETVVKKIVEWRVHRLWIQNDLGKPVACLKLEDILFIVNKFQP